jgi:hypothetical protein
MNLGPGRPRAAIDAAPTVASRGEAAGKMVMGSWVMVLSPGAGERYASTDLFAREKVV